MKFGDKIRKIRDRFSQKEMAEKLGVHPNTIAKYEREDSYPDFNTIKKICEEFNTDPTWLILGEGEESEAKIKRIKADKHWLAKFNESGLGDEIPNIIMQAIGLPSGSIYRKILIALLNEIDKKGDIIPDTIQESDQLYQRIGQVMLNRNFQTAEMIGITKALSLCAKEQNEGS